MEVECDVNNHRVDHSLSLGNGLDGDTHPRLSSPLRATGTTAIKNPSDGPWGAFCRIEKRCQLSTRRFAMNVLEGYTIAFLLGMVTMVLFYFSTRQFRPGPGPY